MPELSTLGFTVDTRGIQLPSSDILKQFITVEEVDFYLSVDSSVETYDFSPLSVFPNLKVLSLAGQKYGNLDFLDNHQNLTKLTLELYRGCDNMDAIKSLTNLAVLDITLYDSDIDLSFCDSLENLTEFSIYLLNGDIYNLDSLSKRNSLESLQLHYEGPGNGDLVTSLDFLSGFENLSKLDISFGVYHEGFIDYSVLGINQFTLSILPNLEKLTKLRLVGVISDLISLEKLTNLTDFLFHLPLVEEDRILRFDISYLQDLANLNKLSLKNMRITSIDILSGLPLLSDLSLIGCNIVDTSFLPYLLSLRRIDLSYNPLIEVEAFPPKISTINFEGCINLLELKIPDDVKHIESLTNTNLLVLELPKNIIMLGNTPLGIGSNFVVGDRLRFVAVPSKFVTFTDQIEDPTFYDYLYYSPPLDGHAILQSYSFAGVTGYFAHFYPIFTDEIQYDSSDIIKGYYSDLIQKAENYIQSIKEQELVTITDYEYRYQTYNYSFFKDFLSVTIYADDYYGGAHGLNWESVDNFDLNSGKILTLEDLFGDKEKYLPVLHSAINENVLSHEYIEYITLPIDMLDEFSNQEFRITPNGIDFIFQIYEIGPYAIGTVIVTVLYEQLEEILLIDSLRGEIVGVKED